MNRHHRTTYYLKSLFASIFLIVSGLILSWPTTSSVGAAAADNNLAAPTTATTNQIDQSKPASSNTNMLLMPGGALDLIGGVPTSPAEQAHHFYLVGEQHQSNLDNSNNNPSSAANDNQRAAAILAAGLDGLDYVPAGSSGGVSSSNNNNNDNNNNDNLDYQFNPPVSSVVLQQQQQQQQRRQHNDLSMLGNGNNDLSMVAPTTIAWSIDPQSESSIFVPSAAMLMAAATNSNNNNNNNYLQQIDPTIESNINDNSNSNQSSQTKLQAATAALFRNMALDKQLRLLTMKRMLRGYHHNTNSNNNNQDNNDINNNNQQQPQPASDIKRPDRGWINAISLISQQRRKPMFSGFPWFSGDPKSGHYADLIVRDWAATQPARLRSLVGPLGRTGNSIQTRSYTGGSAHGGSAGDSGISPWKRVENTRWNKLRGMWGKRSVPNWGPSQTTSHAKANPMITGQLIDSASSQSETTPSGNQQIIKSESARIGGTTSGGQQQQQQSSVNNNREYEQYIMQPSSRVTS